MGNTLMMTKSKLNRVAIAVAMSVGLSTAAMAQETSSGITGSVVGYLLSRWVLNFLDTTASGRDIVPPVVFTADIGIIILTFACLIAAAVLAVAVAVVFARRLRPSDILRTVE